MVDYDHTANVHSLTGARAALEAALTDPKPSCVLDVGCGRGFWLKAALDLGIPTVLGLDGVAIPKDRLLISEKCFRLQNLTESWCLSKRFDLVICVEVGEHLPGDHAEKLIRGLTASGDKVVFSAAIPDQPGQGHINCQWPEFWQALFNLNGFVCDDAIRWRIWTDERIEPWYRQNLFIASRNPALAGHENRIRGVVHPAMLGYIAARQKSIALAELQNGTMDLRMYLKTCLKAVGRRVFGIRSARSDRTASQHKNIL